eukprot:NODE_2641_length_334_cov_68.700483_g2631_i0.p1 GENE.NODE_2641_length_334_cov_68.700483_g2631_i0~~NODE_2641_length_334_cov_68.700483_g2631_i0.p1  ORF type:complete len:74 (-),score=7.08 NODE_2641_length_334_cov_68.700483_g2631_i0:63-284(-)
MVVISSKSDQYRQSYISPPSRVECNASPPFDYKVCCLTSLLFSGRHEQQALGVHRHLCMQAECQIQVSFEVLN